MNRRTLLTMVAAGAAAAASYSAQGAAAANNRIGLYLQLADDPDQRLGLVRELGFSVCEIYNDRFDDSLADKLTRAVERHRVEIAALFAMGGGEKVWDFDRGPSTIGLVPPNFRAQRVKHLLAASDFAKRCKIPAVETHCGFIPEDPRDPLYRGTVAAIREVAAHCKGNGQLFLYHAGQETPTALLRCIEDVGLDNQRVGLDTANPVMYAKGHPADAVEMLGNYLGLVNAKDGLWPSDTRHLGKEVPLGRGKVDFPRVLRRLREANYGGPILIEREISGPQWIEDVKAAKIYLEKLLAE